MPDQPDARTRRAQAEANVALASEFWDRAINRRDAVGAQFLLSPHFVHHEHAIAPGAVGFLAHLENLAGSNDLSVEPVRHIADGDFVVCQHRRASDGIETATIDILRVDEGKIAEWWQVFQPVPETAANPNGMF